MNTIYICKHCLISPICTEFCEEAIMLIDNMKDKSEGNICIFCGEFKHEHTVFCEECSDSFWNRIERLSNDTSL